MDSLWHETDLPSPHYFIHDLFIKKEQASHQLDTVLITSRFVLILEIKSIAGLLNFDDQLRQFSRTNKDGSIDGMRNPDDQLRRHEKWMRQFLTQRNTSLPVIGAIVFTYPSAIVQTKASGRLMIQSSGLPYLLEHLMNRYRKEVISAEQTKRTAETLLQLHSEKQLKRPFSSVPFLKGVICPYCPAEKLTYHKRKWRCRKCAYADRYAHFDALIHYRLLVNPTITNREFREFTGLTSAATASRLLKMADMPVQGSFKDRVYHIPDAISRPESISGDSASN